eukprot:symbB.v1.2.012166.t1/scaffold832.1/size159137/11
MSGCPLGQLTVTRGHTATKRFERLASKAWLTRKISLLLPVGNLKQDDKEHLARRIQLQRHSFVLEEMAKSLFLMAGVNQLERLNHRPYDQRHVFVDLPISKTRAQKAAKAGEVASSRWHALVEPLQEKISMLAYCDKEPDPPYDFLPLQSSSATIRQMQVLMWTMGESLLGPSQILHALKICQEAVQLHAAWFILSIWGAEDAPISHHGGAHGFDVNGAHHAHLLTIKGDESLLIEEANALHSSDMEIEALRLQEQLEEAKMSLLALGSHASWMMPTPQDHQAEHGDLTTSASRAVRDLAWAQAQAKVGPVSSSALPAAATATHGHQGATAQSPPGPLKSGRTAQDKELLNRGQRLLAKLQREELDTPGFHAAPSG